MPGRSRRARGAAPCRRARPASSAPCARCSPPPAATERARGVTSAIPEGTHLLGVDVEAGTATVDLSPDFAAGAGTRSLRRRVRRLVRTATELPGVARVRLRLAGIPVVTLGSSGLLVAGPLTREAVDSAKTA